MLGPNGAGKTTLIKILCTLLLPDSGDAWIQGFHVVKEAEEVKPLISFVPATAWYIFDYKLSAWDNLWYYATLYGVKDKKERIRNALDFVGLSGRERETIQSLSSGMRQRLVIAKGLLPSVPIMFMDEPTIGIDPQGAQSIRVLIQQMSRREGQTIFFTTHYLHEAEMLCNRVAILSHGRILAVETPEKLKAGLQSQRIYLIQVVNISQHLKDHLLNIKGVTKGNFTVLDSAIGKADIRIHIEADDALDEVVSAIRKEGVVIKSVHRVKPTLEDAYLSIASEGGSKWETMT